MASIRGLRTSDLSRFLHITIRKLKYPVTEQVLHQIFQLYGATTVRLCTRTTAVVSFLTMSQATRAALDMQGCCIWDNCCWMQIRVAQEQEAAAATSAAATTSSPPSSTRSPPAPFCVQGATLASPAPSPSSPTAADEEKPVTAHLAELQAVLDRMLANFAQIDDHAGAATSSPSTTTATASDESQVSPEEEKMSTESPKLLSMCSTKCSSKSVSGLTAAAASGVTAPAIRATPHPQVDAILLSGAKDVDHAVDAIQVMAASLLAADTHLTVQEEEEATTFVMPQLLGVIRPASGLHVTHHVQHKEGDEERPMPWPSFVSYCQGLILMQPHQTSQGILLKLVIESMQKVLGCTVSSSALLMCCYGAKSYFQFSCSFPGGLKMMALCFTSVKMLFNIHGDLSGLHSTLFHKEEDHRWLYWRLVLLSALAHFQWEIPWPSSQGCCAMLALWETYCDGRQLRKICSVTLGLVRENSVAELWVQPSYAFNWMYLWDIIYGILGNKTFWLGMPVASEGVWWSFSWNPGDGALFAMDILLVDWELWRTESKLEAYLIAYSGMVQWSSNNPIFSSPDFAAELCEHGDTQSTLLVPLQYVIIFPLGKGLFAPWDPGLHTCSRCCCQTQEICDVLEHFYCTSSWDVEASLKHAHLYIQNDADNMKQDVISIFQMMSTGYFLVAILALCVCLWKKDNVCSKITERSVVNLLNFGSFSLDLGEHNTCILTLHFQIHHVKLGQVERFDIHVQFSANRALRIMWDPGRFTYCHLLRLELSTKFASMDIRLQLLEGTIHLPLLAMLYHMVLNIFSGKLHGPHQFSLHSGASIRSGCCHGYFRFTTLS